MVADITAIVVCYRNIPRDLARCLQSLRASPEVSRILVLDNEARDARLADAARRYGAELLVAPRNVGFCAGVNYLLHKVETPFVLLLNPDAFVEASFVGRLRRLLEVDTNRASASGRLMRSRQGRRTNFVDSLGIEMRRGRRPADIGHGQQYRAISATVREVFGVTAAAALFRTVALREAAVEGEVLPSQFFMYLDDVDLAWRLRRLGYTSVVDHDAVAYHSRSFAGEETSVGRSLPALVRRMRREVQRPAYVRYLSWSNQLLMLVRNDEPGELLRALPRIALHRLPSDVLMLVQAPHLALRARVRFLALLGSALRQRRAIRAVTRRKGVASWLR